MGNRGITYELIETEKQRIIDEFGTSKEYLDNLEKETWKKVEKQKGGTEEKIEYIVKVLRNHPNQIPKENKKSKKIFISKIEIGNELFEEIKNDGAPLFIDKNNKKYTHVENYFPLEGDLFYKDAGVCLASGIVEYGNINSLIDELKNFIHHYTDISPFFETISAYYILLSYIHDKFHTVPYLRVIGNFGVGKTRYLDVVGKLCYKSLLTTGTTNAPGMFRFIELWKGTLVIDEARTKFSGEDDDVTKIMNAGFEKGRSIMRIDLNKETSEQVGLFEPYGTKIIASKKRFEDSALESRCITEIMHDTGRDDIPITLDKNFFQILCKLKNKLLKYRFDNYNNEYSLTNKEIREINIENRLKQSLSAFFILLKGTDVFDDFIDFAKKYNQEIVRRNAHSYEGVIVAGIFSKLRSIRGIKSIKSSMLKETKNIKEGTHNTHNADSLTHNTLNTLNSLNTLNEEVIITANDILTFIKKIEYFQNVSQTSIGLKLNEMGITRTTKNIKGHTVKSLDLDIAQLSKLFFKYIPEEEMKEEENPEIKEEYDISDIVDIEKENNN